MEHFFLLLNESFYPIERTWNGWAELIALEMRSSHGQCQSIWIIIFIFICICIFRFSFAWQDDAMERTDKAADDKLLEAALFFFANCEIRTHYGCYASPHSICQSLKVTVVWQKQTENDSFFSENIVKTFFSTSVDC